MNGQDLRSERERLGFSLQDVAVAADVPVPRLHEWEETGEIPLRAAPYVLGAIRRLERDRMGAAASPRRVSPAPAGEPGLVARAVAFGNRLDGWRASVYWGAFLLLCVSLFGVFALLTLAAVDRDAGHVLYAMGLMVLLAAGGAAGGLAHHAAAPLRRRSRTGRLVAGLLVAYAGLGTILGLLSVGHYAFAFEWLAPELAARATQPAGIGGWLALGVVVGAAIAREGPLPG